MSSRKNVMLTDPLDYRLEVVGHRLLDHKVKSWLVSWNKMTISKRTWCCCSDVPSVNGYEYLVLQRKKWPLRFAWRSNIAIIKRAKNSWPFFRIMMASVCWIRGISMWNGEDNNPDPSKHAKTADKPSTIRHSNPVYVKPPVDTKLRRSQ